MTDSPITAEIAPGRLAIATRKIIDRLSAGEPGQTITLDQMEAICDRNCSSHGPGRHNVDTAIGYCERHHGIVWRWQREKKLWLCLGDQGRAKDIEHRTRTIGRRARRNMHVAAGIDASKLPQHERTGVAVAMAVSGMISTMCGGTFRKLATEAVSRSAASIESPTTAGLLSLMTKQSS